MELNFRLLRADEIDARVSQITEFMCRFFVHTVSSERDA